MAELDFGDGIADETPVEAPEAPKAIDVVVESDPTSEKVEELASDELTEEQREELLDKYYPLPAGFPEKSKIDEWEAKYGRVRIHRVAPNEAYVVRALSRHEMRLYLEVIKKKFAGDDVDPAELRMFQEELLVERCTLWPEVTAAEIRGETDTIHKIGLAGTASILAFDIQEISNLVESNVGPFEEL